MQVFILLIIPFTNRDNGLNISYVYRKTVFIQAQFKRSFMKNSIRLFVAGAIILGFSSHGFAQQTINAGSHSAILDQARFDYSIGEMTLVSTQRTPSLIVTQGYLQPVLKGMQSQDPSSALGDLAGYVKVYPNPTENFLFVEMTRDIGDFSLKLFDGQGKVVIEKLHMNGEANQKLTLDLSSLSAGSYFLMIDPANTQLLKQQLSYNIQKMN